MSQYVGKSNEVLSVHESREAVTRYKDLPGDWSAHRRHQHVATAMTHSPTSGVVRHVSPWQVKRAVERQDSTGDARCERHRYMKAPATVKKHRRRSKHAMPMETKNLIVQLVLATCTITAPQLRNEIHHALGETWSSSAISKARRAAGLTRKRTTPKKREACRIQQHNHAEALINLGYHAEHFIFIDGKPRHTPYCHTRVELALTACSWQRHTRQRATGTHSMATPTQDAQHMCNLTGRLMSASRHWPQ